jgi:hypothetical protein
MKFVFTTKLQTTIIAQAAAQAKGRENYLSLANAWRAGDGTEQEAIRNTFITLWIQGVVGCDNEQADIIRTAGKGRNTAINPAAIDAAVSAFRYNVITNGAVEQELVKEKPVSSADKGKAKKANAAEQACVAALISVCGSRARALEVLNAAK